jgi:hypothetical protein
MAKFTYEKGEFLLFPNKLSESQLWSNAYPTMCEKLEIHGSMVPKTIKRNL